MSQHQLEIATVVDLYRRAVEDGFAQMQALCGIPQCLEDMTRVGPVELFPKELRDLAPRERMISIREIGQDVSDARVEDARQHDVIGRRGSYPAVGRVGTTKADIVGDDHWDTVDSQRTDVTDRSRPNTQNS